MRKPQPPTIESHPELGLLALLHETLQLTELSLVATDRNVVDDEHPFRLPPTGHIARAIIEQSIALQASLDAYERALACDDGQEDGYVVPF